MLGLITRDMACHVLWQFSEGTIAERHRPGDFVERLLDAIVQADPANQGLLARAFPGYVWAVRQMRADTTGTFVAQLRMIARGEVVDDVETQEQRAQRYEQAAYEHMTTSTTTCAPEWEQLPAPVYADNPYRSALALVVGAVDRAHTGTYTSCDAYAIRQGVARALRERGYHA